MVLHIFILFYLYLVALFPFSFYAYFYFVFILLLICPISFTLLPQFLLLLDCSIIYFVMIVKVTVLRNT
jgi:hypothetical protein